MSIEPDRKLDHPIELARDLAELIRNVDRLASAAERSEKRLTETEGALRGLTVNGLLWSGALLLTAGVLADARTFPVPYACVLVDDANTLGPLVVMNSAEETPAEAAGPGRWKIPAGGRRVVPLEGSVLSIAGPGASTGLVYVAVFQRAAQPVVE